MHVLLVPVFATLGFRSVLLSILVAVAALAPEDSLEIAQSIV